jgi:hypothetical protein
MRPVLSIMTGFLFGFFVILLAYFDYLLIEPYLKPVAWAVRRGVLCRLLNAISLCAPRLQIVVSHNLQCLLCSLQVVTAITATEARDGMVAFLRAVDGGRAPQVQFCVPSP